MKIHYKLQEENSEKFTTLGQAKIQKHEPYKNRNTEIVNHTLLHPINHTLSKLKTSAVLKTSLEKLSGQ